MLDDWREFTAELEATMGDTVGDVARRIHERPEFWSARIQDQQKAVYDAVLHWDEPEYRAALYKLVRLTLDALECLERTHMASR